jgi:hypothetical protein
MLAKRLPLRRVVAILKVSAKLVEVNRWSVAVHRSMAPLQAVAAVGFPSKQFRRVLLVAPVVELCLRSAALKILVSALQGASLKPSK